MTSVLVVDDHPLVRAGLIGLLVADGLDVVGEAASGAEAVERAVALTPDIVLMDLSMPGMGGADATRALLASHPAARVVVVTSFTQQNRVLDALAAGAVGFVLKDSDPAVVIAAVHAAARGDTPIDPRIAGYLLPTTPSAGSALSVREEQVVRLVAQGLSNRQIGTALGIAERTVKVHLGNVFRQLGVSDRTSAALWARDNLE